MKVVGYTDRWSAAPGETLRFMVSCELPAFRANIVRLICGDTSAAGPGFKEELVSTPADGEYPGREQPIYKGSYVMVPDAPLLRPEGGFTLQAWVYPTTPQKGPQGILTKWCASDSAGYGLVVGEDGGLALWLGDGSGHVERVGTGVPLRARTWHFVCGGYDPQAKRVFLYQQPLVEWPVEDPGARVEQPTELSRVGGSEAPLLMAGYCERMEPGRALIAGRFNGKIDGPCLFGRALSAHEVDTLRDGAPPASLEEAVLAAWDLGRDFSSVHVTDASPNGLHGQAVNMPVRAVTGHNWSGEVHSFRHAPAEYAAIHFHDDDLEDAGWEADFELTVPPEMRSGVYAAHLVAGESEDYIPFFVRPERGKPSASILFLAPTASYLAYADAQFFADADRFFRNSSALLRHQGKEPIRPDRQVQDQYVVEHDLLSLYDRHSDGSGVCHSSRLRPIVNFRPRYHLPRLKNVGSGVPYPHQFNADLHLVDWMEAKGHSYDVVTDEDLHFEGAELLAPYGVVVTGTHPEYWSGQMLDALQSYLANGGRVMYLGGNGFYWVTSHHPERPHVIEVRRWHGTRAWQAEPGEYYNSTTGELGGAWLHRGRAPQRMLGVGFASQGFDHSLPFRREPGSFDPRAAFVFEGIGEDEVIGDFGLVMEGAGGFEIDRADFELGTPEHTLVLAAATGFSGGYTRTVDEILMPPPANSPPDPMIRADMTYYEGPNGGGVFSVSSIAWCGSLWHNNYDNNVSRITDNVLRRFASPEPLPMPSL